MKKLKFHFLAKLKEIDAIGRKPAITPKISFLYEKLKFHFLAKPEEIEANRRKSFIYRKN